MTGAEYCKSCKKSDVCMYTKDFVKVVDEANEKDNIIADYRCKFYKSKTQGI